MTDYESSNMSLKKLKKLYNNGYKFYCEGLKAEDFSDVEALFRNAYPYCAVFYEVYHKCKEVLVCARWSTHD